MVKPTVILIVVAATSKCSLNNIDGADMTSTKTESEAACQVVAEQINRKLGVSAFCMTIEDQAND